jgi:MFS family permease
MKAIQVALALGIAVLLPLLADMTVRIWASPPESTNYYNYYDEQPKTAEQRQRAETDMRKRNGDYEKAQAAFNLQVFYVAFPLGVLEVLTGFLLRRKGTLAAGILFGGLGTISCGSFSSWDTLPGIWRYTSLVFVLLLLGTLAYALDKNKDRIASAE